MFLIDKFCHERVFYISKLSEEKRTYSLKFNSVKAWGGPEPGGEGNGGKWRTS